MQVKDAWVVLIGKYFHSQEAGRTFHQPRPVAEGLPHLALHLVGNTKAGNRQNHSGPRVVWFSSRSFTLARSISAPKGFRRKKG